MTYEVYAIKYAEQTARVRGDNYMFDDNHDAPDPIDFYMWLIRGEGRVILVDTGFDAAEGQARGRPIRLDPGEALKPFGLQPEDVTEIIVTHLHFDHAGGLHLFPNAQLHLQTAEMAYATGPCMCHDALRFPFTVGHVVEAVQRLYSGKITFHDGDSEIADGITVHRIGGHTKGMQAVRIRTQAGWLVLASDAAHFYGNFLHGVPFPIVVDMQDMLDGFATIQALASAPKLVVPGHDPLVRAHFPAGTAEHVTRLDVGPLTDPTL
ncbi:N-acyl homoserine lactonase family protein [Tateyamaria omphalii]|uniref:MBL fold hydrolase n=1 Tax=Tateyamaria omphalii TaxID=299262 RepID=A0A1P8MW03_9RHOB|nr:N-acyl homoserine lactonase family protein [Tateyamaria omphalii]APX12183.1 MBL fold hydrolase [Tateyamaria omphalii]